MTRNFIMTVPLLFLFIVLCTQTGCQNQDLSGIREELQNLVEVEKGIRKELQDIKRLVGSGQAPAPSQPENVVLNIDKSPFKGEKDAKVTLVEFSDFQCPFCGRHVRETIPQLDTEYIKTGKIKYVFKDFPLESIHKNAFKASEAANCAGDQGKYWEMHDKLFENQKALNNEDLLKYAGELNLNTGNFEKCLNSGTYASTVRESISEGQKAGVTGTPAFFLAINEGNDSNVKTSKRITGAQPYANFKEAIDDLLSSQKK
jgi:protein-disulfide isomerase